MLKKINKFLALILFLYLFIPIEQIFALSSFPAQTGTISEISHLYFDGSSVSTNSNYNYPNFNYKKGNYSVVCISGLDVSSPGGMNCNYNSGGYTKAQSLGVAYLINTISGNNGGSSSISNTQYYFTELIVTDYLGNFNKLPGSYIYDNVKASSSFKIANTNKTWSQLINEAKAYSQQNSTEFSASLSSSDLKFTLNATKTAYVSNRITVNDNNSFEVNTNVGSSTKNGADNSFIIEVPVSALDSQRTKVEVTVNAHRSYYTAGYYTCGGGRQDVTLTETVNTTETKPLKLSGIIDRNGKLTIKKVDSENKLLKGATLKIDGPSNYTKTIETDGSEIVLDNLDYGTYTITEISAPDGYLKAATQTVVISAENSIQTKTIVDKKTRLTVLKVNSKNSSDVLEGANLELQNSRGETLKTWTTKKTAEVIEGLKVGETYYVVETSAPKGYVLSKLKKPIVIEEGKEEYNVIFTNDYTKVEISKVDALKGSELPGATIQILDSKKNKMSCKVLKDNGEIEELKDCTWISTDKPKTIVQLEIGTYYMVETIAPEGYVLNKEEKQFKVDGKTEVTKVSMKNDYTKVEISKVDALKGSELPGATIQILDSKKNKMSCKVLKDNGEIEELKDCTWISTDKPKTIVQLEVGTYYMVETVAPEGYVLNKEEKQFKVDGKTDVIKVSMKNDYTNVKIKKVNNIDGRTLEGAILQVLDSKGNEMSCKIIDNKKIKELKDCMWTSSENSQTIIGLKNGKYYLIEKKAPEGYVLNSERQEFQVDGINPVINVKMTNVLEVEVPNTLSMKSTFLLAVSMFDIAIGIGILIYVKKNKIKQ